MINWVGGDNSPFLSSREVKEIITLLKKRGMVGTHSWMTVGYGYQEDGDDVDWHNPDSSFIIDEFWEQEVFELRYNDKNGYVVYPFQRQFIADKEKEEKIIKDLQDNIEIYVAEILYDQGYETKDGVVTLESFDFGSGIEINGRNDNFESQVMAAWTISLDATKIIKV